MTGRDQHHGSPPPAASVVTTVYNRERSLSRAMRSVLEQSFTDFEYIVVDDGSTDESVTIAESTGDDRVKVVRATHKGRAAALNTAFALCRGEFILIQDSDDIALPERFAKQIAFMREHPEVGMVGCQCRITSDSDGRIRPFNFPETHDELIDLMMRTSAVVFGACTIRRRAALLAGDFDESLVAAEDYDFQLRMLRLTRMHNIGEVLQEIMLSQDSQSVLRQPEQNTITKHSALAFLEQERISPVVFHDAFRIRIAEALVHYYYGELRVARDHLLRLVVHSPRSILLWRYLLPTFLGESAIRLFRRRHLTRWVAIRFKFHPSLRRYFLP
ncbi:MAG: glycosyltransferase [Bacteroidota bacterium]